MEKTEVKLKKFLMEYSFEDLAKSFFILNIWLPNVSSHTKSQYLYIFLESIFDKLQTTNKINTYEDFKDFSEKLLPLIPSFHMMEDYLPENDWGEIKYFLDEKFYKIFYGGDLENTYDFMYSFETVHYGFKDFYLKKLGRSPKEELEFCLNIQDSIINGISKDTQDFSEIEMGDFTIPTKIFWESAIMFLDNYDPRKLFSNKIISEYTRDLDVNSNKEIPSEKDFIQAVHEGTNCFYFFIKKGEKIFPVLPRKYFSVLFDKWGKLLTENYQEIKKDVKNYEIKIGLELFGFINKRTNKKEVFCFGSAIKDDLKPHKTIFTSIFKSKDKLILIHVLPPATNKGETQKILDSLTTELKDAQRLFSIAPTRVGLRAESMMVQFESTGEKKEALKPIIITIIPSILTSNQMMLRYPKDLVGEVFGLDQFLGIMDELNELDELSDFLDYLEQTRSSGAISFNSTLDHFGSFRDSHSVLIEGANNPDMLVLDMHWGTSFRYKSLLDFWENFPKENFFGHPRSWAIKNEPKEDGYVMLKSKTFFGFTYCYDIKSISIFINSPIDSLSFEQGKVTDSLMHSLIDSFKTYRDLISGLSFTDEKEKIHVLFFPSSLVKDNEQFKHIYHLIPENQDLWLMDTTRLKSRDYGIRVVYDDEKIISLLRDAKDRSLQITLFKSILEQINSIFGDNGYLEIEKQLDNEKSKKNRFRMYAVERKVSFPELSRHVSAETRELKLADKKLAEIGKEKNIKPNKYEGIEAKEKLDLLRTGLINYLNERVSQFNLKQSIPVLISNIDSLSNDHERKEAQVESSMDQEVDYEREEFAGKNKVHFLHEHKNYRYLVEKFVQLQPSGNQELSDRDLAELLALVDRILLLYAVSDFLLYGLSSSKIIITHDFLVEMNHEEDIEGKQKLASETQAKINLGIIGNTNDHVSVPFEIKDYIEELDKGFLKDLGFSLKDMIDVHMILSLWAVYNPETKDNFYYSANVEDILKVCKEKMEGVDPSTIIPILNFLTLDPQKILRIEGKEILEPDLPVWEQRKRTTRYSLRPLIKVEDKLYWGAYSVQRSRQLWGGIASNNKLPSDINVPTVSAILKKGHDAIESSLQEKIKEVVSRFTSYVETEVYPHNQGFCTDDIGDFDVFALLKEKNIILNIESKIIDQAFCNKDLKRIAEKIFGRKTSNGSFEEGYLHMAIKRDQLLKEKGRNVAEKFWGSLNESPKVISLFVTQTSYWWTKYPLIESDIHFIEIQLLEDFIRNLTSDSL